MEGVEKSESDMLSSMLPSGAELRFFVSLLKNFANHALKTQEYIGKSGIFTQFGNSQF